MDGGISSADSGMALEELEAQITELAGHLNAAQYRWLMLIREFDRRLGWAGAQIASCAHWLNFKCGLNLGAAREKVRVAHALGELPRIAASMAKGELSYSKVRALTRVACPATEENLLMIALHGTAHHVETIVRLYRRAQQAEELSREARQQSGREVQYHFDEDGSLVLRARLPALGGAMLLKAIEAAMEELPATETSTKTGETNLSYQARRADALAHVALKYFNGKPGNARSADRFQVVLHVDAESFEKHSAGRCHLEDGPAVPVETARRIACDAAIVTLVENEQGEPLDVGRKTRNIPPAIRRALNARDNGCRFPGCTYKRFVEAHHVEHWADGGETKLSNLVTLCRWHHRLVHEGEIVIETTGANGGEWRFVRPGGDEYRLMSYEGEAPEYVWSDLSRSHADLGLEIDRSTAVTRWRGEKMDYDLGVWVLCNQAERARRPRSGDGWDVSAETFDDV